MRLGKLRNPARPSRRAGWCWAALVPLLAALAAACAGDGDGTEPNRQSDGRVHALTSLELFADMVGNVGGDRVEVAALLPSGADPHTFELAPGRVADISRADVVFINGLGLEGSLSDVVKENAAGPVVELTSGLETLDDNPHLWLDVGLAARYVETIRDALIEQDPGGREEYEANADAYLGELSDLDREMQEGVKTIPPENRKLVTFHDAFPYLARRYGLKVVAVVAVSPGKEPSARDVARLVETLRSERVPAVFREPQFNNQVLELAAQDEDVRVLELLSGAFAEGVDSYAGLMRFDLRQLEEGLGGD